MERSKSARIVVTLAKLGLVVLLGAVLFTGTDRAIAEDAPAESPADDPGVPDDDGAPPRAYFQQFPDDPRASTYEELTPPEQEAVMLMAERTDYDPVVHRAWSTVARNAAADAAARQAEHASGISGIDEIGVE
jgi:hypothetical protein